MKVSVKISVLFPTVKTSYSTVVLDCNACQIVVNVDISSINNVLHICIQNYWVDNIDIY